MCLQSQSLPHVPQSALPSITTHVCRNHRQKKYDEAIEMFNLALELPGMCTNTCIYACKFHTSLLLVRASNCNGQLL